MTHNNYRSFVVFAAMSMLFGTAGPVAAAERPAGVGPNGELEGLTAKFIDVNGVSTRYFDYGQGEPIVMVHGGFGIGMSSTANNWSRNLRGLSTRFRAIAVDRVGQGMAYPPNDIDVDAWAYGIEHVYQFIRALGLSQVHLAGHSSGARLSLDLALEHPEIIKTLTIVAGPPRWTTSPGSSRVAPSASSPSRLQAALDACPPPPSFEYSYCRLLLLGHTEETFPMNYAAADEWMSTQPPLLASQRFLEARNAQQAASQGRAQQEARAAARLEKVRSGTLTMPILIIHGMQDGLAWRTNEPYRMFVNELSFLHEMGLEGVNTKVKMLVYNASAHFPYRDHPEQFNADLMNFIDFWNDNPQLLQSASQ